MHVTPFPIVSEAIDWQAGMWGQGPEKVREAILRLKTINLLNRQQNFRSHQIIN